MQQEKITKISEHDLRKILCKAGAASRTGLRIFWASGAGDIAETYRKWNNGNDDDSIVSIAYSAQMFELCEVLNGILSATANCPKLSPVESPAVKIESFTKKHLKRSGIYFYLGEMVYVFGLALRAKKSKADVAVISVGITYCMLFPFKLMKIPVLVSLHNTHWPRKHRKEGALLQLRYCLDGYAFRNWVEGTVAVSPEIIRQTLEIAGQLRRPILQQIPQYRSGIIELTPSPFFGRSERFRIMFAGRLEPNKGIYTLLNAAKILDLEFNGQVEWIICGTGSVDNEFKEEVEKSGMSNSVVLAGYLKQAEMAAMLTSCHATITPTTNDFPEGLSKLPLESVLAGRPAIISSAIPAIDLIGEAALEFEAESVPSLCEVVRRLLTETGLYESMCLSCIPIRSQFFDRSRSWASGMFRLLTSIESIRKRLGLSELEGALDE